MNRGPRGNNNNTREVGPRINRQIRIPQIRLIDQEGEQLGVVETAKALELAEEADLDLVEVAPNGRPPVCRIMDYGKYQYEQSKKAKKGRQHASQLKEIRMRVRISDHDYQFKMRHVEKFLTQRHKVRVAVEFRGRENAHRNMGRELLARVEEDLKEVGQIETPARDEGRNIFIIVAPKSQN
ncbi:MAG: translation initiation factor IF-3 [Candidatus Latescibacteria bacterium]|nr:translation initiation factor IF-3 [Candidatus Latescibacterota bacterium]